MDDRIENEPTDDVAFARVQAADPAAGSEPNLPVLYAAVAEGTGVTVAPQDELAARRSRRAPRWLSVAAAVAGVAVIGGGSYAYGLNNAPPKRLIHRNSGGLSVGVGGRQSWQERQRHECGLPASVLDTYPRRASISPTQ